MIDMREYGKEIIGPIIYEYISWVLCEAQKNNNKKIYFLARDGYLLKKIAEIICRQNDLDISCRYLYVSRMSLRMPSYHIIGEEAYQLLLLSSYHMTPYTLMRRLQMDEKERETVYKEIGIEDENQIIERNKFEEIAKRIRISKAYRDIMVKKSSEAYPSTVAYLRQEQVYDDDVVLVDSGWEGSLQRSLRQIMQNDGYNGTITGYYFGLFADKRNGEDGLYKSFYFDAISGTRKKALFDNVVFECMLSAPHGMTIGYEKDKSKWRAILKNNANESSLEMIHRQISGAIDYANSKDKDITIFNTKESRKEVYRYLTRAINHPTKEEVLTYNEYAFCDDISDDYNVSMSIEKAKSNIKYYMLLPKVWMKFIHKYSSPDDDVIWPVGITAFMNPIMQTWCKLNIYANQWIKYYCKEKNIM